MPTPSLDREEPVLQIHKFDGYGGELSGLLYHSPHTVLYEDELYRRALHLFEARKFLDHRPDLAERIRECDRCEDATYPSFAMPLAPRARSFFVADRVMRCDRFDQLRYIIQLR
jgi:hypothetical protein